MERLQKFVDTYRKMKNDHGHRWFRQRSKHFNAMQYTGDNAMDILKWIDPTFKVDDNFDPDPTKGLEVNLKDGCVRLKLGDWIAKENDGYYYYSISLFRSLFEEIETI